MLVDNQQMIKKMLDSIISFEDLITVLIIFIENFTNCVNIYNNHQFIEQFKIILPINPVASSLNIKLKHLALMQSEIIRLCLNLRLTEYFQDCTIFEKFMVIKLLNLLKDCDDCQYRNHFIFMIYQITKCTMFFNDGTCHRLLYDFQLIDECITFLKIQKNKQASEEWSHSTETCAIKAIWCLLLSDSFKVDKNRMIKLIDNGYFDVILEVITCKHLYYKYDTIGISLRTTAIDILNIMVTKYDFVHLLLHNHILKTLIKELNEVSHHEHHSHCIIKLISDSILMINDKQVLLTHFSNNYCFNALIKSLIMSEHNQNNIKLIICALRQIVQTNNGINFCYHFK